MGNLCCQDTRPPARTVTYLSNSLPDDARYRLVKKDSIRFSEISVRKAERNIYLFSMCIKDEVDIHSEIPVLNQIVHCITCENYELQIGSRAIVDIFCKQYSSTLIDVKNKKTGMEMSMKVVPFSSYTSNSFKQAFYELWINKKIGINSNKIVKLLDYFIYGLNTQMQAFVLLFEKCSTSLANVAEYRREANVKWNEKEKIKVLAEILESYDSIKDKNIVHRDLRPSNIFYCPSSGRFSIGNFSKSRLIRRELQDDLMSVCGVPYYSCNDMETLMGNNESIGYYKGLEQDYFGLKSILNLIDTCDLFDQNSHHSNPHVDRLIKSFQQQKDVKEIIADLNKIIGDQSIDLSVEVGDREIAKSCSYVLAHTHKDSIEKWVFETYGLLGYNKEFSNKAHRMLELNNEKDRELDNAPILCKLGEFYEAKGSKGTQYFYNAFVLYLKRSEKQYKYGFPEKAEEQLDLARQTYLKFNRDFQSELPRIQISIMNALIEEQKGNHKEAVKTISQTFFKAAQENIPVEKQCKVLLAYGTINKSTSENRDEAMKKLVTGLSICENGTSFESPSSCRIFKSHFLYEIGTLHLNEMLAKHDPKRHNDSQSYGNELVAKAETNLRSSLEIRQRQAVDEIDVADSLQKLAVMFYHDEKFYDSKKYYDRTLIRLNQLKDQINHIKQVRALYMKGSCCYYLNEFADAKREYESALRIISKMQNNKPNMLFSYNIEGNLGLTLIQMGEGEGQEIFDSALEKIKEKEGERSYDYVCLRMAYAKILKQK